MLYGIHGLEVCALPAVQQATQHPSLSLVVMLSVVTEAVKEID